jgi:hypothetical protein
MAVRIAMTPSSQISSPSAKHESGSPSVHTAPDLARTSFRLSYRESSLQRCVSHRLSHIACVTAPFPPGVVEFGLPGAATFAFGGQQQCRAECCLSAAVSQHQSRQELCNLGCGSQHRSYSKSLVAHRHVSQHQPRQELHHHDSHSESLVACLLQCHSKDFAKICVMLPVCSSLVRFAI